jgi:peptidoglycan/xylan/chitin deacetylase (PgdA/CDA1 family)
MLLRSQDFIRHEIEAADAAIVAAGQAGPIPFRPPFGKKLLGLPWFLEKTGRTTVMWNIEPESTRDVEQTPEGLAAHVFQVVSPGSILLLHAMNDPSGLKIAALELMLAGLTERGYQVVGFSELQRACAAARPGGG